ncbi:MAG: hypothetical protein RIQ78_409 [Bacteroidota bacterium]|jgi:hypothetical protein
MGGIVFLSYQRGSTGVYNSDFTEVVNMGHCCYSDKIL